MAKGDTVTFDILQKDEHGPGAVGTSVFGEPRTYRRSENGIIVTTIKFDITGLTVKGTSANDIIGLLTGGYAFIGRYETATCGIVFKTTLSCIESPTQASGTYTLDIDVDIVDDATLSYSEDGGGTKVITGSSLVVGQTLVNLLPALAEGNLYLTGHGTTAAEGYYGAGQYVLRLYGHAALVGE